MIWTPNGSINDAEDNPVTFRVDLEHMQYLTPSSCAYIADMLGLEIIHLETLGFPALQGINSTNSKKTSFLGYANLKFFIKKGLYLMPGVLKAIRTINRFKQRVYNYNNISERMGSYCLFCIFRKK
ncbi:MAG: hypothetical protein F6K65_36410 [Moorea sp. SIO3C2]|nr:hypothetical protein [Moorena sp. SIO3C2]